MRCYCDVSKFVVYLKNTKYITYVIRPLMVEIGENKMPLPCELAVRSVVPAIRALVARELSQVHQMKQEEIASLLDVTQSAISQYMRSERGKAIDLREVGEVQGIAKELAYGLTNGTFSRRQITQKYCEACRIIREKRLLCDLHRKLDPYFSIAGCDACIASKHCF